jgi:hypothetical protein
MPSRENRSRRRFQTEQGQEAKLDTVRGGKCVDPPMERVHNTRVCTAKVTYKQFLYDARVREGINDDKEDRNGAH